MKTLATESIFPSLDIEARNVDHELVVDLARSIKVIGLKCPILVRPVVRMICGCDRNVFEIYKGAGRHRYEAMLSLGLFEIAAEIAEPADLRERLVVIDRSLSVTPMGRLAEQSIKIAQRNELREALGLPAQVARTLAPYLGRSDPSWIWIATRRSQIGVGLLSEIAGTSLDKGRELDALRVMTPADREAAVLRVKAGDIIRLTKQPKQAKRLKVNCLS